MKKYLWWLSAALIILNLNSCSTGLGEEVDLEAPVLTVKKMQCYQKNNEGVLEPSGAPEESFETTKNTKTNVTFEGTASDNSKHVSVHAEIKWLGDDDYTPLDNVTVNNNTWSLPLAFKKEGACWLKITAEDKSGNYSPNSSKIITLFVDETAPVGDFWYIDRMVNGVQYNLQSLSNLKEIVESDPDLSDPSNKDVAQNGEFFICASVEDASDLTLSPGMKISLFDENDNLVAGNIEMEPSSSNYAPKFRINGTKCGLPVSGIHYYQIKYTAEDPVPNKTENQTIDMGWFLWWPESDNPRCHIANLDGNSMQVATGDSINVTVFDDDALDGTVSCTLSGKTNVPVSVSVTSSDRQKDVAVKAPREPQTMTLTVNATDIYGKTLTKSITVFVTDDFVPTLILTSPENNQIPQVSGNSANIHFEGITLDKSGCKYLELVWVPDSVKTTPDEKNALAKKWLDEISATESHDSFAPAGTAKFKMTPGSGEYEGCKLWSAKLTPAGSESLFIKHSIDFDISLLNEFGSETTKDKYFIARVSREDGNKTDTEIKLASDNLLPEIVPVSPAGNMAIIDQDSDLYIKFKGEKSNGVEMDVSKYKLSYVDETGKETVLSGSYDSGEKVYKSEKIPRDTLADYAAANITPKYKMEVEDVLGNKNTAVYQFIISALPQIKNVTSSAPSKCKKGDEISINVSFTKPVSCTKDTTLNLRGIENTSKGITASTTVPAEYSSGSGSTTLVFKYTVKEGDKSDELEVYNPSGIGPISGMDSASVHLDRLTPENNLQAKRSGDNAIKLDGVSPKVIKVNIVSEDAEDSNEVDGIKYLKAGRTVSATVITSKKITVQGSPKFLLRTGTNVLELTWQDISKEGTSLRFSKKVAADDVNGAYSYFTSNYLSATDVLKDEFGNELVIEAADGTTSAGIVIDTFKPSTPVVTNTATGTELEAGKYKNSVSFTLSTTAGTKTQYSTDGGSEWTDYTSAVTLTEDASLVVRAIDYAGNVSDYSKVLNIQVNNTFPAFTMECTTPDGKYRSGTILEFKLSFANPVNIQENASAYISISGSGVSDVIAPDAKAVLKDKTVKNGVTSAVFVYTTKNTDDFTLSLKSGAVNLAGFTDQYGITYTGTSQAYSRPKLRCDSVAPSIVSMVPQGTKTTQNGLNAYNEGNKIILTFNENVKVVSGKIYLRQTAGWAIPPMFTASEFNTVLNAVKYADIDESKTYGLTGSEVLYMDGLEDAENLFGSLCGAANDRYHGTAQYTGPYKKMTNGVDNSGNPDLSVKYVLDFGVDIRDSNKSTKNKFGLTFVPNWTKDGKNKTYTTYHHLTQVGNVNVITPENTITTDSIRYVLEQAGYHQRSMNVNSTYVSVSGNTVTLNFPQGLLGDTDLPKGREWELVIEKGAFMDETGNYFGAEEDGSIDKSTEAFVLVPDGSNNAFMSAGVEEPVIRVDRYSYGLGIYQPTKIDNEGNITHEKIDILSVASDKCIAGEGSTVPSAKVAVRIDTPSKGAKVRYTTTGTTKIKTDATSSRKDGKSTNYYSNSAQTLPEAPSGEGADDVIFLAGSGDYVKSSKEYIKADALYSATVKSTIAKEGIFQTVVNIDQPKHNGYFNNIYNAGNGKQTVNIHGTTGLSGEPTIVPFPLRDQPVASAYMRHTYQKKDQYYWLSYEVLVDAGYSMYVFGQWAYDSDKPDTRWDNYGVKNMKRGWNDWARTYALMKYGEFNYCNTLESWPAAFNGKDSDIVPDNKQ